MSNARGYLLEGDLYIARFVGGVPGPLLGPYEGAVFSMQPQNQTIDMISRGRNSSGEIIESVSDKQPTVFNVTLSEGTAEILAMALMGNTSALAQASGNFSAAPFNGTSTVVVQQGEWVALPRSALSGPFVLENATNVPGVEGVDYNLNRQLGMVRAVAGSTVFADGATITIVSGAFDAVTGTLIEGGTVADIRAKFVMDGRNRVDGADITITVHEAVVSAANAVDFLNQGFLTSALQGRMKKPVGENSAFKVEVRNAAV